MMQKIRNVDSGYVVFDAIETSIEYSEEEFYLFLLPSIHILKENDEQVSNDEYKIQSNRILSRFIIKTSQEPEPGEMRAWA